MTAASLETIQGVEYTISDEGPFLDGDYIRNILVLGLQSKNAWNANRTGPGDVSGPRRKFNKIISSTEEVAKFDNKPAYMLHKPQPRSDNDLIGTFSSPKPCTKGLRMDLLCRKVNGSEEYVPQVIALRDNVQHKRDFGGFSPTMDFTIDPTDGETQTILGCESIDLVPQPASVKSAVEGNHEEPDGDEMEYVTKEEHEKIRAEHGALEERVKACECYMSSQKTSATEEVAKIETVVEPVVQRSATIPEPKKISTTAKSFAEFIRS